MSDWQSTVIEALNSKWKVIDAGGEVNGFTPEGLSIFTVSDKEVIGCSEWMRAEKAVFEYIVNLHNQQLASNGSHRNPY